jgi:hypothetical protein
MVGTLGCTTWMEALADVTLVLPLDTTTDQLAPLSSVVVTGVV